MSSVPIAKFALGTLFLMMKMLMTLLSLALRNLKFIKFIDKYIDTSFFPSGIGSGSTIFNLFFFLVCEIQ